MVTYKTVESILTSYTFKEICEYNDLTEEDALLELVENGYLHLPPFREIDFDD